MSSTAIAASTVTRLFDAIERGDDPVKFSAVLPRDVAQKVFTLLSEERKGGAVIVRAADEFRTSEAAVLLGVSRPHLSRLINDGQIEARRVGAHWRIPASAIATFQSGEKADRVRRMEEFAEAQNAAGLFD